MANTSPSFTRAQKILIVLHKLAGGTKKQVRFENIAVEAFKQFKSDFQLKGYPQYPDTGDIVHKPLYSELKKDGYVLSGNKYFSLTSKGLEYGSRLIKVLSGSFKESAKQVVKLTASQQKEIERIITSPAFKLFNNGKKDDIIDIDFYSYLGVTVRTNKFDFLGRLSTVEDAIQSTKEKSPKLYEKLSDTHKFLLDKFKENVEYVKNSKGGKR